MKTDKLELEVEAKGLDEIKEKVDDISDAVNSFTSQVVIRGARDCVFNIYPNQTLLHYGEVEDGENLKEDEDD
jgi:hypothetical protein